MRFELTILKHIPHAEIISPWKDPEFLAQFSGRTDLLNYAKKHNIPVTSTLEKPYSIDENLMHTSYEGGKLEDPAYSPQEEMFRRTSSLKNTPDQEMKIAIEFQEWQSHYRSKSSNWEKNHRLSRTFQISQ